MHLSYQKFFAGCWVVMATTSVPVATWAFSTVPAASSSRTSPARFPQIPSSSLSQSSSTEEAEEYGVGMDQQAMMESDILIVVDENDLLSANTEGEHEHGDLVIASKKQAHSFSTEQPRGICHRAFSLFLFNPEGELLLTQRAASKITFPSVWTNTCCSHPLVGMVPDEVDVTPEAYPRFDGIKHAAVRKVRHELGITSMEHSGIRFVSRFHYWASDTQTHGPQAAWGEHEVDYILFCQMEEPQELSPDPEEVSDHKYVSIDELKAMMEDPALTWSPWFLGIMEKGGFAWWEDLENSLAGKNTNPDVTFFDPVSAFVADYNLPSHTRQTGVMPSSTPAPR